VNDTDYQSMSTHDLAFLMLKCLNDNQDVPGFVDRTEELIEGTPEWRSTRTTSSLLTRSCSKFANRLHENSCEGPMAI